MKLFLGVDGGQSGTTAVIGDETGRVLGAGEAGPCNHAAAGEGRAQTGARGHRKRGRRLRAGRPRRGDGDVSKPPASA